MKPMIKYRGGKTKEIALFEKYIPNTYKKYIEPFLGGGALYFYLNPSEAIVNDINTSLMNFYQEVRNKYDLVRAQLNDLQNLYENNQIEYAIQKKANPNLRVENKNESLYYNIRDMFNHKIESCYLDSVLYFFINKTSYSGMIRYNSLGEFNVPFGRYQNFNTHLISNEHVNLLKRTKLFVGDYNNVFELATQNDFMFLDPPYDCIFNDYGNVSIESGFDECEQRRLAANFKNLTCKALMVIGKTPLTVELYGDYIRDEYFKSYAVNIRNRFKSESKHIVVTNYTGE
jgi:DNA adenine methylase